MAAEIPQIPGIRAGLEDWKNNEELEPGPRGLAVSFNLSQFQFHERNLLCMGIPRKPCEMALFLSPPVGGLDLVTKRKGALFGQGIPMGIPLILDLGNSLSGNSTSLLTVAYFTVLIILQVANKVSCR